MNKITSIFFLFSTLYGLAQQSQSHISQVASKTLSEIENLLQQSAFYSTSQIDSALYFANQASDLSKKLNNDSITVKIRAHKGGLLILSQRYDEAESLLLQNIKDSKRYPFTLGKTHHNLGNSYNFREEFEKATFNYLTAAEIFEALKDTSMLGKTYNNLGVIYARLKDYDKAILYMDKAVVFSGSNALMEMQLKLNLSGIYYEEKQVEKAIATSLDAERLAKKNNARSVLAIVYSNLCRFYLDKSEFDKSIANGLDALELKRQMKLDDTIVLNNLGYAYLKKGDDTKAQFYLNMALPTAIGESRSLLFKNLSETYANSGNDRKALKYANLYIQIKDSLNLLTQQKNVGELVEKYESEKKQQQLDLLNAKDELNQNRITYQSYYIWALAVFSILAILVGFLLYRNYRTTQSLKAAKIQHRLLQTQLNPHFLFNALNSIQAFGYANKQEKLSDYIDSFSNLMRSILESSDQDFITIEEDAQTLKEYLYLQELSTEGAFETRIIIDSEVDDKILIPPMFTQPFVENSVLHGVKKKKDGLIEVRYAVKEGQLIVTIQDNGDGMKPGASADKLHRSMGMDIMKDRVVNLQKTDNYKCSIEIDSGKFGTSAMLTFPVKYKKLGKFKGNG